MYSIVSGKAVGRGKLACKLEGVGMGDGTAIAWATGSAEVAVGDATIPMVAGINEGGGLSGSDGIPRLSSAAWQSPM